MGGTTQAAYFLTTLEFQNPTFSGVNTAPTMEVHAAIMLILFMTGNEIYKAWVSKSSCLLYEMLLVCSSY
jgi:hypothetical protein